MVLELVWGPSASLGPNISLLPDWCFRCSPIFPCCRVSTLDARPVLNVVQMSARFFGFCPWGALGGRLASSFRSYHSLFPWRNVVSQIIDFILCLFSLFFVWVSEFRFRLPLNICSYWDGRLTTPSWAKCSQLTQFICQYCRHHFYNKSDGTLFRNALVILCFLHCISFPTQDCYNVAKKNFFPVFFVFFGGPIF